MVTGASTADLAVILIDARKGVLTQTRRHSFLVRCSASRAWCWRSTRWTWSGYSRGRFDTIVDDYRAFAARIGLSDITAIPLSAVYGDNIIERGANMAWYQGPTLMQHLEGARSRDSATGSRSVCRCSG